MSLHEESTAAALGKVAPPAVVTALDFLGVPLEKWVLLATLIYTFMLIGERLVRWGLGRRDRRRERRAAAARSGR